MKMAVLSDIHGNLPALQTVATHIDLWQPDAVIVAGDIVNRGPQSLACWQFLQAKAATAGWQLLKGNHEEYVISRGQPDNVPSGPDFELSRLSWWTYQQLHDHVAALAALPDGCSLVGPAGREVRVRHASMLHNRDGIYQETETAAIKAQIAPPPGVFVTAHTHKPFVRLVSGTLVVNAGSVGTPADGDGRASYAQLQWRHGHWQAHIIRLAYDVDQARQDYFQTGSLAESGPLSWLIFYEWQLARYIFPVWMARYWQMVLDGVIDVETAVRRHLHQERLPVPVCRGMS